MKVHRSIWSSKLNDWAPACGKQGEVMSDRPERWTCEDCEEFMKAREVIMHAKKLHFSPFGDK